MPSTGRLPAAVAVGALAVSLLGAAPAIAHTAVPDARAAASHSSCTPEDGFDQCRRFWPKPGEDSFQVPGGVKELWARVWGGGGGGSSAGQWAGGGGGGYVQGLLDVEPGKFLAIQAGQGGGYQQTTRRGGQGGAGGKAAVSGSAGGDASYIKRTEGPVPARDLLTAGGGGGAAGAGTIAGGGGGGRPTAAEAGQPGTQTAGNKFPGKAAPVGGCTRAPQSGHDEYGGDGGGSNAPSGVGGGGGGGGFSGGGGGGNCGTVAGNKTSGGGGGSNYFEKPGGGAGDRYEYLGQNGVRGNGGAAGGDGEPLYLPVVGVGGKPGQAGGPGQVVLQWKDPKPNLALHVAGKPAEVAPGGQSRYTLEITNTGDAPAYKPTLKVTVPDEVTKVKVANGKECTEASTRAPRTLDCQLDDSVSTDHPVTVTLEETIASNASGQINQTFEVVPNEGDKKPSGNRDDATTPIKVPPPAAKSANVRLDGTGTPEQLTPGQSATYTFTASNQGPDTSQAVSVNGRLPDGLTATKVDGPGCTHEAKSFVCKVGDLAKDQSKQITVTAAVDTKASGALTVQAQAVGTTPDPNPNNNTANVTKPVKPAPKPPAAKSAHVQLKGTGTPDQLTPGESATYTFIATNEGPDAAQGVRIKGQLPEGLTVTKIEGPENRNALRTFHRSAPGCTHDARAFDCQVGGLAKDQSKQITVTTKVDANATGTLTVHAQASAATDDPKPGDNTADVRKQVKPSAAPPTVKKAHVRLDDTATPAQLTPGQAATYTFTATNEGPDTAQGVRVTGQLSEGLSITKVDGPGCTHAARTFVCKLGDLAKDQNRQITVTTKVDANATGALTVQARASGTTDDPNPENNTTAVTKPAKPAPPTKTGVSGTVVSRGNLNIRAKATTHAAVLGKLTSRSTVALKCKSLGQPIGGNRLWYKLDSRTGWVPARYVKNNADVPRCATPSHNPHHHRPYHGGHHH